MSSFSARVQRHFPDECPLCKGRLVENKNFLVTPAEYKCSACNRFRIHLRIGHFVSFWKRFLYEFLLGKFYYISYMWIDDYLIKSLFYTELDLQETKKLYPDNYAVIDEYFQGHRSIVNTEYPQWTVSQWGRVMGLSDPVLCFKQDKLTAREFEQIEKLILL